MAPRIWLASGEDVNSVTALIADFRNWWGKDTPSYEEIREPVSVLVEDPATDFLLGATSEGDEAAGVCQLRYRLSVWTAADDCWLEDLFVRDDARGAGLGRALVEAAVERAVARGCRRMELDVNESNEHAIAFYESLGFATEPKPPGRTLFLSRRL